MTKADLVETKEHSTRNKRIACLKVAAVVIAAALTVLGILATFSIAPVFVPGTVAAALIWMGLSMGFSDSAGEEIEEIEQRRPNPEERAYFQRFFLMSTYISPLIAMLGTGIIAPLVEAFTRESRLESVKGQQEQEIAQALTNLREDNEPLLSAARDYFEKQDSSLNSHIDRLIHKTESAIRSSQALLEKNQQMDTLIRDSIQGGIDQLNKRLLSESAKRTEGRRCVFRRN